MQGTIRASILTRMRHFLTFAVLVALIVPASSSARRSGPNDGTLSLKQARGVFTISARGGLIGSFAHGSIRIVDPVEGDGSGPIVSGEEFYREIDERTDLYRGSRVRFRIIGGAFRVIVRGRGINLSLVGKGNVTLNGAGTEDDGTYSINDGVYEPVPSFPFFFPLSATTP
jgi:hypothetical protein